MMMMMMVRLLLTAVVLFHALLVAPVQHVESPVGQFDDPATVHKTVATLQSAVTRGRCGLLSKFYNHLLL